MGTKPVILQLGDIGMVWSLDELKNVEDKKLLGGHVALLLGEHNRAQSLYLQSSTPEEALHMRRDLLQWDQALHLANKLAPDQIPFISKEYAQQLEFTGNYVEALQHYERGWVEDESQQATVTSDHNALCKAGMARTSLRCGQLKVVETCFFVHKWHHQ